MSAQQVQLLEIRTPEGVAFTYRLASPVLRLAALVVDWAAVSAAWILLSSLLIVFKVFGMDVMHMVVFIAYFLLTLGYSIAVEWFWRGQSIGKRLLRIRVIDARGYRLSWAQVVSRNILRVADGLPAAYLFGGASALLTRRSQRLGDIVAGTLVIWEQPETLPDLALIHGEKYNSLRGHAGVVARLRHVLPPEVARVAWEALARRGELDPAARVQLFAEMAAQFRALTPIPPELSEGLSDEQFVRNVVDVIFVSRG